MRKIVVSLVGSSLLIVGVILVPLPGPGFLVIFLALLLLSTEFEWTKRYVDQLRGHFKKIYQTARERSDKIANKAESNTSKQD